MHRSKKPAADEEAEASKSCPNFTISNLNYLNQKVFPLDSLRTYFYPRFLEVSIFRTKFSFLRRFEKSVFQCTHILYFISRLSNLQQKADEDLLTNNKLNYDTIN